MRSYVHASAVYDGASSQPCDLKRIDFQNVSKTKKSALLLETLELYKSKTLDDLIKNAHMAASHMQEVGLLEQCTAFVEKNHSSRNGFDIRFVVKEPKAVTLGVKMGVATSGTADGSITAAKQSIFGSAEAIDASYSKTLKGGHNFNINAIKPWLGWQSYRNMSLNLRRGYEFLSWNNTNFTENALALQYGNMYLDNRIAHIARLNASWRTLLATSSTAFRIREHAGHTMKFSVENIVSIDKRSRPVLPEEGSAAQGSIELAALMGDSSFIKCCGLLQSAARLPFGAFLNASLETQMVQNIGSRMLHVVDRVYLGGPHDVRGFQMNSIGPREDNCALGSAFSMAMACHIFYPLVPRDIFFAHAFVSAGSAVSVRSRHWINDAFNTMRCSTGFGIAAALRNIRFELNYVVPIANVPGDKCAPGFYFGAGTKFL